MATYPKLGVIRDELARVNSQITSRFTRIDKSRLSLWTEISSRDVTGVIFSRDRPLQLDALLTSHKLNSQSEHQISVILYSSNQNFRGAYNEVKSRFAGQNIVFVEQDKEDRFKETVEQHIRGLESSRLFFLVDDQLFIRPFDVLWMAGWASEACIPSLRLGLSLRRTETKSTQSLPAFHSVEAKQKFVFAWMWGTGDKSWGYPYSLDGHIFMTDEILPKLEKLRYRSPSSLELELQKFRWRMMRKWGICDVLPCLLNIPANRVQSEIDNTHAGISTEDLCDLWRHGSRLDVQSYQGFIPRSTHEQIALVFRDGPIECRSEA